jgi:hypothetical protein
MESVGGGFAGLRSFTGRLAQAFGLIADTESIRRRALAAAVAIPGTIASHARRHVAEKANEASGRRTMSLGWLYRRIQEFVRSSGVSSQTMVEQERGSSDLSEFHETAWGNIKKNTMDRLFSGITPGRFDWNDAGTIHGGAAAPLLINKWISKQLFGNADSNSISNGALGALTDSSAPELRKDESLAPNDARQGEGSVHSLWEKLQEILKNALIEGSREAWDRHLDIIERNADNGGRFVFEDVAMSMRQEAEKARKAAVERVRALERAK